MSTPEDSNRHADAARAIRQRLAVSLALNWLGPVVIYFAIRRYTTTDATALAVSSALPLLRVAGLWLLRRRIDWLGAVALLGLGVTIALSVLMGGSALPIKLIHPALTGTLGLLLLASALLAKPLLRPLLRLAGRQGDAPAGSAPHPSRIGLYTGILGGLLLADALVHVVMALDLSTGTFVLSSRAVGAVFIAALIGLRLLVRPRRR